MVVEDEWYHREALVTLLSYLDLESVSSAANGELAIEQLSLGKQTFDIIFTDLQMPVMDGLQLLEHLGEIEYSGGVFICSHMEQKIIDLAIELARRQSIHLIGCIDKSLNEDLIRIMLNRAQQVRNYYSISDHVISQTLLSRSLNENCLIPVFQPKLDIFNADITGFEVLSRIKDAQTGEIISPDRFIPVASRCNLVNQLTFVLLEIAIPQFQVLEKEFQGQKLELSVNICPSQLDDDHLPIALAALCKRFEFPAKQLVAEITESDVIETDIRLKNLDRLRLAGFGCSLDDFGMGFTSIRQIHNYPFTEVKLDKSLVMGIEADQYAERLCEQLYAISEQYKLNMVIEGIETESQLNYFRRFHNVRAQGFFFTKPLALEDMLEWLEEREKKQVV